MLYTIGHEESYEQYFREQDEPMKLGRGPDPHRPGKKYIGGSVFETFGKAAAACPEGFRPYGLITDLDNTYIANGGRHLIESCLLRRLGDEGEPLA